MIGTYGTVAAGVVAAGAGAFVAAKVIGDRDPWTLDYPGPGSVDQIPSMLAPWLLPATGAGAGAMALAAAGRTGAATAVGVAGAALFGAGMATWIIGKSRD